METWLASVVSATVGAAAGGVVSYLLNRQKFKHELELWKLQNTSAPEQTLKMFLDHKGFTDRSFETIRRHMGGYADDELRKLLVKAGAMRVYRDDGSEWWRLVARQEEFIEKKDLERIAREI